MEVGKQTWENHDTLWSGIMQSVISSMFTLHGRKKAEADAKIMDELPGEDD